MRKVVFGIGTLALILIALTLWLAQPTPSSATPTASISKVTSTSTPIPASAPKTTAPAALADTPNTTSSTTTSSSPAVTCDPVWTQISSPTTANLHAVAAVTTYDAWAVGDSGFIRWNGTSWNAVAVPTPPSFVSFSLRAISSRQASDIWAAGSYSDGTTSHSIVYHWDGTSWTQIVTPADAPEGAGPTYLDGITPIGAGIAIAVGHRGDTNAPIILRCTTSVCTGQSQPVATASLLAVDSVSSTNIWAAGVISGTSLFIHYDGTQWSQINTANVGAINGITAIAPADIWAVGETGAVHWNGTSWTQQDTFPGMSAISGLATNDIWAVGIAPGGNNIRHYNGTWTGSVSTGGQLNGVSARAANDVWAVGDSGYITRYAASQQFDDVPLGSTFFSYVQDLSCRAIISGYACGGPNEPCNPPNNLPYYRSTANVTRGQLSKIIILAANIPTPSQTQTFEDVPVGSTFHPYVEALAFQNAIGGYPCGGPGEPCGPGNKPYFRPNITSTRGQTAKIVAITAGYTDPFQSQTFEDVPTDSTFYTWIENLASRNIINGYPCGGPNEPCGSGNRPYFRTGNNVTRGQMSKIAVITFTP